MLNARDNLKETYDRNGYVFPIRVFPDEEADRYRKCYLEYVQSIREELAELKPREEYRFFAEAHAYLPWVYEMATSTGVLDAVEAILGPDLMIWDSRWFAKPPRSSSYVSWHQDGVYYGLTPPNVATAWIALTRSGGENGAMQVIPGSHRGPQLPHEDKPSDTNILARGQEISVQIRREEAVTLELKPGEMSIHHVGIIHGSEANRSDAWRIGLAVRFITPDVVQNAEQSFAMLVRGEDRFGHFTLFDKPAAAEGAAMAEARVRIIDQVYGNLMRK
ncbi:MAG TPA: phytanoyl-CoA dioxygenase family protein [Candidatus Sumerlaeota bacterium]|nr:phytanoyl-CoA dioxygenase family protein [Candidatus Sumerlaeota bacterium]